MKELCFNKRKILWKKLFQNFNVALGKTIAPSNVYCLIEKWKSATHKGKSIRTYLGPLNDLGPIRLI